MASYIDDENKGICLRLVNNAVSKNKTTELKDYAKNGVPLQDDTDQEQPIHTACRNGYIECVRILLDAGVDLDTHLLSDGKHYQHSALYLACQYYDLDMIELLLGFYPDLNIRVGYMRRTALHALCEVSDATRTGGGSKIHGIKMLLAHGANPNITDADNETPLHKAIGQASDFRFNHPSFEYLCELIVAGADFQTMNRWHQTPLHLAAASGKLECLTALLALGADPNAGKETPLHHAAVYGNEDCVEALVKNGADVNAKNLRGITPAHYAAKSNNVTCLQALWSLGADLHALDNDQHSCYEYAARRDYCQETIKFLQDQGVKLVKMHTKSLHYCCRYNFVECAKYLLEIGHNPNSLSTSLEYGQSPLHIAAKHGNFECLKLLIKHGGNPDINNQTPYQNAMVKPLWEAVAYMTDPRVTQVLLGANANPNVTGYDKPSPPVGDLLETAFQRVLKYWNCSCDCEGYSRNSRQLVTARLLIQSGCDISSVHWLQCPEDPDITAILNPAQARMLSELQWMVQNPRPLTDTCRLLIRSLLEKGREFYDQVEMLPLPVRLKRYLMFDDEVTKNIIEKLQY